MRQLSVEARKLGFNSADNEVPSDGAAANLSRRLLLPKSGRADIDFWLNAAAAACSATLVAAKQLTAAAKE